MFCESIDTVDFAAAAVFVAHFATHVGIVTDDDRNDLTDFSTALCLEVWRMTNPGCMAISFFAYDELCRKPVIEGCWPVFRFTETPPRDRLLPNGVTTKVYVY